MKISSIMVNKSKIALKKAEKYIKLAEEGGFSFREYLVKNIESDVLFTEKVEVEYIPGNALLIDGNNKEILLHKINLVEIITSNIFIDILCEHIGIEDKIGFSEAQGKALYLDDINNFMDSYI